MSSNPPTTKNARREASREKARLKREKEARKKKRNKILSQVGIAAGVLGIAAIIVAVVVTSSKPSAPQVNPANLASNGAIISGENLSVVETDAIPVGSQYEPSTSPEGKTKVDVYLDYLCPFCGQFEAANNSTLADAVKNGDVEVEIHPLAVLNRFAGEYSARSANAAACVVNYSPDSFWEFNAALFANQPAENSAAGLRDSEIYSIAEGVGLDNAEQVESCINDGEFSQWVDSATESALNDPVPNSDLPSITATPTVIIDGQAYEGDPKDSASFKAFLDSAVSAKKN